MTNPFSPQFYPPPNVTVGIGPPNLLYYPIGQAILPLYATPIDFRQVTGVTIHVNRPDGSIATWVAGSMIDVTSNGLVAVYAFQTVDCPVDGNYGLRPYLSVSGFANSIPCASGTLAVSFR